MNNLLIRNAEIAGTPGVDVRIAGGRIVEIGPGRAPATSEVLDAGGGVVIPGLHDHHVHLRSLAAARSSVRVGPPEVGDRTQFQTALRNAAAAAPADPNAWIRAVGYHESVAGPLDAGVLDEAVSD